MRIVWKIYKRFCATLILSNNEILESRIKQILSNENN